MLLSFSGLADQDEQGHTLRMAVYKAKMIFSFMQE